MPRHHLPRTGERGSAGRPLLLAAAAGLVAALLAWWRVPWQTPPQSTAPIARAPAASPLAPQPEPGPRGVTTVPATATAAVRAALRQHFAGLAPPRELMALLVAGDVAAAARRLEAMPGHGGAALLWDLGTLCGDVRAPAADADPRAADARASLDAAALDPATRPLLERMVAERRDWLARLAAGCAAAHFDPTALQRRLQASAAAGDAASLERLASVDTAPFARLTSAALLGAPRAQLRLAVELLAAGPGQPRTSEQQQAGLAWLQAAARGDADAESYYGSCLLGGCYGAPDPVAARSMLEHAAQRGASAALGLLVAAGTPGAGDVAGRWSPLAEPLAAVPPRDPGALGLGETERYAWAAFAEHLAQAGCFGFDFTIAGEALASRARLERTLRPSQLAEAAAAAERLWSDSGATARAARGCE